MQVFISCATRNARSVRDIGRPSSTVSISLMASPQSGNCPAKTTNSQIESANVIKGRLHVEG